MSLKRRLALTATAVAMVAFGLAVSPEDDAEATHSPPVSVSVKGVPLP